MYYVIIYLPEYERASVMHLLDTLNFSTVCLSLSDNMI